MMHLALTLQHVDPARGGAETYVADLCRRLVAAGCRVDLHAETWRAEALTSQVNVIPVETFGRTRLERLWSFARESEASLAQCAHDCSVGFINTYAHDVIIPQGGVQAASLLANARRRKRPGARLAYVLAKSANPKLWVQRAIERRQYDPERGARVVAVSRMVKRDLETFHHVPPHRIHVVYNAIDPARLAVAHPGASRAAARNRLGFAPADLVALFPGHNHALKGLGPLIEALAERGRLAPSCRPIHVIATGDGRGAFRRLAARRGVAGFVHFLGFEDDVRGCYQAADFFAQPTYYDPCSLVVLEALASGLPVITTMQNGASELLTDGREGRILTSPDAQGELARALDLMTVDAERLAMAAHARALGARHTLDDHVARLLEVFEEAAVTRRRKSGPRRGHEASSSAPHFNWSRTAPRSRSD